MFKFLNSLHRLLLDFVTLAVYEQGYLYVIFLSMIENEMWTQCFNISLAFRLFGIGKSNYTIFSHIVYNICSCLWFSNNFGNDSSLLYLTCSQLTGPLQWQTTRRMQITLAQQPPEGAMTLNRFWDPFFLIE